MRAERAVRNRSELAYAGLYAAYFATLGAYIAFGQIWLSEWGLTDAEIGWLTATALAARIAAGVLAPMAADASERPRAILVGLAVAGAAASALHLTAAGRGELYSYALLLAVLFAGFLPIVDAHGWRMAEQVGFSYRRARSAGSFAFLAATFLAGLVVDALGSDAVKIWMAAALAIGALAALAAPMLERGGRAAGPNPGRRGGLASAAALLLRRRFALVLLAATGAQASHAVYYVYGSLHWRSLGYSDPAIGGLWAWGVAVEILLFSFGRSVLSWLGPERALLVAGLAAVVRWAAMTTDPSFEAVVLLQAMHAGTFALVFLAGLALVADLAPKGSEATAQGLLSAGANGLGLFLATSAAAWAYPIYGAGAYWIGAVSGAIGAAAAAALMAGGGDQPQSAGDGACIRTPS